MCVQVPCVYLLYAASTVTKRNNTVPCTHYSQTLFTHNSSPPMLIKPFSFTSCLWSTVCSSALCIPLVRCFISSNTPLILCIQTYTPGPLYPAYAPGPLYPGLHLLSAKSSPALTVPCIQPYTHGPLQFWSALSRPPSLVHCIISYTPICSLLPYTPGSLQSYTSGPLYSVLNPWLAVSRSKSLVPVPRPTSPATVSRRTPLVPCI